MPDVVDALAIERLLRASGSAAGFFRRTADRRERKRRILVYWLGSWGAELGAPDCPKIYCMYGDKQAMQYKRRLHGSQAYLFYIDIHTQGKGYVEYKLQMMKEDHCSLEWEPNAK